MAIKKLPTLSFQIFKDVAKGVNDILRVAVKEAVELTGADRGVIFLSAGFADGMEDITYLYPDKGSKDDWEGVSSVIDYMMERGRPIMVADYPSHLAINGLAKIGVKAFASVPIFKKGDMVVGTIGIFGCATGKQFDREDLKVLQFIASQTVVFVENALLFQKVENAKKEWEDTFDAMVDPVMIVDKGYRIIRCNKAMAQAFKTTPAEVIGRRCCEIVHGKDSPWPTCPHKESMETGRPVTKEVDDPHMGGVYDVSISPLLDGQGNLYATVHMAKDITQRKILEETIRKEARINQGLLKVTEVLGGILDRDEILKKVVETVPDVVNADICFILLWDENQNAFLPAQVWGMPKGLIPEFRKLKFTPGIPVVDSILKGETVVVADAMDSLSFPKEMTRTFGMMAILNLPIVTRHKVTGIIGIGRSGISKPFGRDDESLLYGITNYAVTALENAQLYRESIDKTMELTRRVETISVMHEIDRTILSSLDSQEILDTTVYMVLKVIPADKAMVVLVDNERRGFIYVAGFGVELEKGIFVAFDDTTATEVVRTKRPHYCHNLKSVTPLPPLETAFLKKGFRSHMRVPLLVRGEVIGILCIGSKRVAIFTPEHLSSMERLADQIAIALENAKLLTDLKELLLGIVKTLSGAIDAKSPWTAGHSERVTEYALAIAREMGMDEKGLKELELAGLLHDIGKIGTSESILDKPGSLIEEEMDIVRLHPKKGAEILTPIKQLKGIIPGIKYHHEFYDGMGYPDGLKGESIPLMARILGVADAIDAMGADRPYRKGRVMNEIIAELKRCSGTQFDPKVVEAFLRTHNKGL